MKGLLKFTILALLATICLSCQSAGNTTPSVTTFSVPDLGFRYTPPARMKDETSPTAREAQGHAATYAGNAAELLLDMSSDESDTAPDWHQLWIFIFPRARLSQLNDSAAGGKMNTVLAGPKATAVGQPKSTLLAGHSFVVSEFEQNEPPLVKHAKIFTTVCKGQLVSFVFVSNSGGQISAMEETLKTLDFSSH
jgi:hypothetical protein